MNERYALPAERRDPFLGAGLWGRRDLVVLAVPYVLGAVALVLAWYGSAEEAEWRGTGTWLVTAAAAVSLAGFGLFLWLAVGKVRIAAAEREVRRALLERSEARRAVLAPVGEFGDRRDTVTASGMRRYHRPSCLLMTGKRAVVADRAELAACGVCEP